MSETVHSSLKSAVKGTSIVFLGMVASILLWFVTKVLIIRHTTQEELGIYSLAVAIVGITSSIATLGLQEGVSRYISIFHGEGNNSEADAISGAALRIGGVSGFIIFVLLFIFSDPVARYVFYKPEISSSLRVVSFFVPASVMTNVMIGILRGYNAMRPKVLMADIGHPFVFLVLLCIVFLFGMSFVSVMYVYSAAMVVILAFFWIYGRRKIGLSLVSGGERAMELLRFSIPLLGASIMGIVLLWTDTLMLGRYAKEADVGIYNAGLSLARLLTFPLGALEFAFMSVAGWMYAKGEYPALKKMYQVLTKWNFAVTLPIFFVLFLFPEVTLTLLFGDRFIPAVTPLRILAVGFLFQAFTGANAVLIMVIGRSKELLRISLFGALLNILLNYIFIKKMGYGITGSSVATALSYIVIRALMAASLYRHSGIHPITANYLLPVAGSLVITAVIYAVSRNAVQSFWLLPFYFILFIAGYAVSLLLTKSICSEDIALFEAISKKTGLKMNLTRRIIGRFIRE